ncbi:MAG: ADP-ribosylation factor-like protein [Promethearchaeia archaeon]
MSESAEKIIKFFCERFLDIDYYPSKIKKVRNLSIEKLKGLNKKDIKRLEEIGIKKINDFRNIQRSDFEDITSKTKIKKSVLQNGLIAATLIANAWQKRKLYTKKMKKKITVAGLDYAGKTSIINRLFKNQQFEDVIDTEPTRGAKIEEYESNRLNLVIWDLGGQKNHIDEYLSEPEKFFLQINVLIYVVDVQDDTRYDESVQYLRDIIDIIDFLNEYPYVIVLLHKADTDVMNDPDYQIRIEYLTEKISEVFEVRKNPLQYEMIPTSIYNMYANEPEIARDIKFIFSNKNKQAEIEKPKISEEIKEEIKKIPNIEKKLQSIPVMEKKIQKILEINLQSMNKVKSELNEIKRIMGQLVPSSVSQSLFSIPFKKVSSRFLAEQQKEEEEKREKELKKKRKKGEGPPQRLDSHPKVKKKRKDEEPKESEQEELGQDETGSLIPPSTSDLEHLKPPPNPPKSKSPSTQMKNPAAVRGDILSELKEMFVKKGLAKRKKRKN